MTAVETLSCGCYWDDELGFVFGCHEHKEEPRRQHLYPPSQDPVRAAHIATYPHSVCDVPLEQCGCNCGACAGRRYEVIRENQARVVWPVPSIRGGRR